MHDCRKMLIAFFKNAIIRYCNKTFVDLTVLLKHNKEVLLVLKKGQRTRRFIVRYELSSVFDLIAEKLRPLTIFILLPTAV